MNNFKQTYIPISFAAVVFGLVGYLFGGIYGFQQVAVPQISTQNSTGLAPDVYDMRIVSAETKSEVARIRYEYPQFKNASSSFNGRIAGFIEQTKKEFESAVQENYKARLETASDAEKLEIERGSIPLGEYIATWKSVQHSENIISLVVDVYAFSGGANGSQSIGTFNYDLLAKKEITLAGLFQEDSNYLNKISRLVESKARQEIQNRGGGELFKEGLAATEGNYELFTVEREGVRFYFPKYAITAGAFGDFEIFVGFDEVAAIK